MTKKDTHYYKHRAPNGASELEEHGLNVEAIIVPGDDGSSIAPAIKQSIEFFKGR